MTQVKRPLDEKMEGKVPPVEAKTPPGEDDNKTDDHPVEEEEAKK